MRPEDLKIPYTWEDRRPLLLDGLLLVPNFYSNHSDFSLPCFADRLIFGNENPVHCEVCSGNGDWVVEQAIKFPLRNWIAVERRFDRVRKIFSKRSNHNIQNLFIVFGEALTFFSKYLSNRELENIYVHFPDPWPKHRHAKHRLIKDDFVIEVRRVLKDKGDFILLTDDFSFLQQSIEVLLKFNFQSQFPHYEIVEESNEGKSWFESLWRSKGKMIYRAMFEKWDIADLNS